MQITYSPTCLGYIIQATVKEILTEEKVKLIYDLNTIQESLGKGPLSPKQFDELYDSPSVYLISLVRDQSSLLCKY